MNTYLRSWALEDITIQRSGDGRTVEAYAAMFDSPYEVRDQFGHYMEVIDRAAFTRTLNNGGPKAVCLFNHGMTMLGTPSDAYSVPIGVPLEIRADNRGLFTVTRYNMGADADRILEAIRNGAIRAQSFRGRIFRSTPDRVPLGRQGGQLPTVTRLELGLTDYGPTPVPVNAGAEILAVRSAATVAADLASLPADERAELVRMLASTTPEGDPETPTPTPEETGLGAEDPPTPGHSGRQSDLAAKIRRAKFLRGMK